MLEVITIVVANDSEILKLTTGLEKEQVIAVLREAADAIEEEYVVPEQATQAETEE